MVRHELQRGADGGEEGRGLGRRTVRMNRLICLLYAHMSEVTFAHVAIHTSCGCGG